MQFICTTLVIAFGFAFLSAAVLAEKNFYSTFWKYQNQTHLHQIVFSPLDHNKTFNPNSPGIYNYFQFDPNSLLMKEVNKWATEHGMLPPCKPDPTALDTYNCMIFVINYLSQKNQYNYGFSQKSYLIDSQVIDSKSVTYIASTFTQDNNGNYIDRPFSQVGNHENFEPKNLKEGHVIVEKSFADSNNIHIGGKILLFGKKFVVDDLGIDPTFLNLDTINPLKGSNHGHFVLNTIDYNNLYNTNNYQHKDRLVARLNNQYDSMNKIHKIIQSLSSDLLSAIELTQTAKLLPKHIDLSSIMVLESWTGTNFIGEDSIYKTIVKLRTNSLIAKILLAIILVYTLVIVYIISKRQINNASGIIGILKALGYKSWEIVIGFSIINFITCFIGAILGFLIGFFAQIIIYNNLAISYPGSSAIFSFPLFVIEILLVIIFIYLPSLLFLLIFVKKNTWSILIKEEDNKVNIVSKSSSYLSSNLPFSIKFPIINASKAIGKIVLIILTINTTTIFGLFAIITTSTISMYNEKISKNINYNYEYWFNFNPQNYIGPAAEADYKLLDANHLEGHLLNLQEIESAISKYVVDTSDPTNFKILVKEKYIQLNSSEANSFLLFISSISPQKWTDFKNGYNLKNSLEKYCSNINLSSDTGHLQSLFFGANVYNSNTDLAVKDINTSLYGLDKNALSSKMIALNSNDMDKISLYKPNLTRNILDNLNTYPHSRNDIPVIISSFYANQNHINVGDEINLFAKGSFASGDKKAIVSYVYEDNIDFSIYAKSSDFNDYFIPYVQLPNNQIYSKGSQITYPEFYESISINNYSNVLKDYSSVKEIEEFIKTEIDKLNNIIIIFIFVSVLWNIVVLLLIGSLIIQEYSYFISIMKILGYSSIKITNLFVQIYLIPILIGFILALPIEYLLLNKISSLFAEKTPFHFAFEIEIWQVFVIFITIILLVLIAYLFTFLWIRKIYYLKLSNSS